MPAIPLLSGIQGTDKAEFAVSYPLNLEPVAVDTNLSKGQLRPTAGAIQIGAGPSTDRGGTVWNGRHYRVMGTSLVEVAQDGTVTDRGVIFGYRRARFDHSFDRLGIHDGDTNLFFHDGSNTYRVTDGDLGVVKDALWADGYWLATDGVHIVVTELADQTSVLPLKYGSAEEDPDPITGLMKVRGEVHAVGRHTIQPLRNIGGAGFPFAAVRGATIPVGCVSASAKAMFGDTYAFVGSARNEALGVYLAGQGSAAKISTRAIDDALAAEPDVEGIEVETRTYRDERRLFVHLGTGSWVFLSEATKRAGEPIWYRAQSASGRPYRVRNAVEWNGRHMVGDIRSGAVGYLSETVSSHFGEAAEWGFQTGYVFNEGAGGIIRSLELIGLPGTVPAEESATAFLSMTRDGRSWSVERAISMGRAGERTKRLQWRPHSRFTNYVGFRFRGFNRAVPGFARLEARIDPLGGPR